MGYRAWFTRVDDLDGFKEAVRKNPNAHGIYYTIDIPSDNKVFRKGLWVAWAGDGDGSLTRNMPAQYISDTLFLDEDVLPVYPEWRVDPAKYGRCDFTPYAGGLSLAEADGTGECLEDWFVRTTQDHQQEEVIDREQSDDEGSGEDRLMEELQRNEALNQHLDEFFRIFVQVKLDQIP